MSCRKHDFQVFRRPWSLGLVFQNLIKTFPQGLENGNFFSVSTATRNVRRTLFT